MKELFHPYVKQSTTRSRASEFATAFSSLDTSANFVLSSNTKSWKQFSGTARSVQVDVQVGLLPLHLDLTICTTAKKTVSQMLTC